MPFGGEHYRALGRDEMLPLLLQWGCVQGCSSSRGTLIIPPKQITPQSAQPIPASTPVKEATVDMTMEPAAEKRPLNKFPGLEKVLHPSRPIVAAWQIPPLSKGPRWRPHSQSSGEGLVQIPQTEELRVLTTQLEPPPLWRSWGLPNEWCCHLVLPG